MKLTEDEEIGVRVAACRERAGISMREMARQMTARGWRWSPTTASKLEVGARPLRASEMVPLAEVLGAHPLDFLSTGLMAEATYNAGFDAGVAAVQEHTARYRR